MDVLPFLSVTVFFVSVWAAGEVFSVIRAPLVGQILVGLIMGPGFLDTIPHAESFELVGIVGLVLLVVGGGLHLDLSKLRQVGWRAAGLGSLGTVLPVACGWLFFSLMLGYSATAGVAAGIALAPSSIGIALKLLQNADEDKSPLGTLITAAAMLDDVLSLLLLAVMSKLGGNLDVVAVGVAAGTAVGASLIVFLVGFIAHWIAPYVWRVLVQGELYDIVPDWKRKIVTFVLLGYSIGLTIGADLLQSTYLLGAFMAGFSFADIEYVHTLWENDIAPFEQALSAYVKTHIHTQQEENARS
eukprot:TRINITY_DN6396_c0_g1_i1.p1 TRINITY_DN6396_c0_g1~~TRINITY_DN6396_c0_g1_i1.p1  ORF type:complete len:300 (+),score=37.71 TRINITY_DN6396_c0_g1_i1:132-1031(+)